MKKKLILISMLLAGSSPALANITDTSQITTALGRYCVPKEGDTYEDTLVCGSVFEGRYSSGPKCTCSNTYLTYDAGLRRCKVTCLSGHQTIAPSGSTCPSGFKATSGSSCPAGYRKITIN